MGAALEGNFIEGGSNIDPFTGLAPALTPEDEQRRLDARRAELRAAATRTANRNTEARPVVVSGQQINPATGQPYTGDERPNPGSFTSGILPTLKAISKDPVTMGVLTAPYAVLGAGAALGGLASGGAGSLVGASEAPGMAFADTSTAGAEAAMNGARVPVAAAAGNAAPAAAPSLGSMIGADLGKYAAPVAMAAAPTAINAIMGGRTKEEKQLVAKQEQLAAEAKVRQGQQQDARMNALGQQLLAFNPTNQMMAQMFGPQAAFQPEQMAAMAQGPKPAFDPAVGGYTGTDPKKLAAQKEMIRRQQEYDQAEAQRREMLMNGIQQPGPGPAPIQMPTPQAARRY